MDNGEWCWVGFAPTGILVKKSIYGLFGAKLYVERDFYKLERTAEALGE